MSTENNRNLSKIGRNERAVLIHGVIALAALTLAFFAWRHSRTVHDESDQEAIAEVVIADLARSDLEEITYHSEKRLVEIRLGKGDRPSWITVTTETKVAPAKAAVPNEPQVADGGVADGGVADGGAPLLSGDGGEPPQGDGGPLEASPEVERIETKVEHFAANDNLSKLIDDLVPIKAMRKLGKLSQTQLDDFELGDTDPHGDQGGSTTGT